MKAVRFFFLIIIPVIAIAVLSDSSNHKACADNQTAMVSDEDTISLPQPKLEGKISVEETLAKRRSVREISDAVIEIEKLSQLLWAAQGVTHKRKGFRTAPSAGAKYPLEIYIFAGNVLGLQPGLYRYLPEGHKLVVIANYDKRRVLGRAIYKYERIIHSAAVFVIGADFERTQIKYGTKRGPHYVYIEAGACAQNIALQAEALYLSTVCLGAFDDVFAAQACQMNTEQPILIMPIGYKQK
ncbi:MAG: SagB/ThcOx family dehydrogenase [candidate division Zixibacteria bacterium]|nr:SagB/ThcOx family dehydrogenase [candidate division Zixibacteria bacterium]